MPSYLPGIFVVLAGIAMIVARESLSLMQYAALEQARIIRDDRGGRDKALSRFRRVIIGGSVLFIIFGSYLALNPLPA